MSLKSIKGIGKEKGDKQFLVWIALMQFRINLAPKTALTDLRCETEMCMRAVVFFPGVRDSLIQW